MPLFAVALIAVLFDVAVAVNVVTPARFVANRPVPETSNVLPGDDVPMPTLGTMTSHEIEICFPNLLKSNNV